MPGLIWVYTNILMRMLLDPLRAACVAEATQQARALTQEVLEGCPSQCLPQVLQNLQRELPEAVRRERLKAAAVRCPAQRR